MRAQAAELRKMAQQLEYMAEEVEVLEKTEPMVLNGINDVYATLTEVQKVAQLKSANFSRLHPDPANDPYPVNEKEVDAFIKARIGLWFESWIAGPITSLLNNGRWG